MPDTYMVLCTGDVEFFEDRAWNTCGVIYAKEPGVKYLSHPRYVRIIFRRCAILIENIGRRWPKKDCLKGLNALSEKKSS